MTALLARSWVFVAAFGLAGAWGVGPVVAAAPRKDPTVQAEELGAKARDAYKAQRFDRAIELYLEAYENAPDAGFLFNIAYIYDRKLGELDLARDYYRRVVAFQDASEDLVSKARAAIVELDLRVVTTPPDKDKTPPDKGKAPPDKDKTPPDGVKKLPVVGPGPEEAGANYVPWVLVGGGGLLLATGLSFAAVASGTEDDFHSATDNARRRELQSTGRTQAALADVFTFVGIAAVGTGVVLWLLDAGADESGAGSVHVAPVVFEGGAALTIGGSL